MADLLVELFDPHWSRPLRLGYLYPPGSPQHVLTAMLGEIVDCLRSGTPGPDPRPYVTALHALVLDLVDLTGARTDGRRRTAHTDLMSYLESYAESRRAVTR